jgi:pimeloyl-ACP methyl ester carboxylesterase
LTVQLPDGRLLGIAELGDPSGWPVLFFHGTPGSRLVLSARDALAQIPGVRLILSERPGYGLSTPQPGRTLLAWADDVAALADQLHLDAFVVSGISGGGPHALACAYRLPHRVRGAIVLASPAPAGASGITRGMSMGNRIGLALGRWAPGLVERMVASFAASFASDPQRFLDGVAQQMSEPDRVLMQQPDVRDAIERDVREAYRQGSRAQAQDGALGLTGRSWGFDLEQVRVPVYLWHGEADRLVSRAMAEYLEATLPNCHARFVPDAGHLLTERPDVIREVEAALHALHPSAA